MPRGDKNAGQKIGKNTRFNGATAAKAGKRSQHVQKEREPLKKALQGIATDAIYGHPPLDDRKLEPIRAFYDLPSAADVTFAHLAMFKLASSAANGVGGDLDRLAAYCGEKPAEKQQVEVYQPKAEAVLALERDLADDPPG